MTATTNFEFTDNTTEGFFNEGEQALLAQIQTEGSGVYKLTQDKQGQFTAAVKTEDVSEEGASIVDGRIAIVGEETDYLYVKFVI